MSVVEGRADIKICCVRSTSTGTRRVVRPSGGGWSILWREEDADRWAWFIGKKFAFFRRKTPLLRLERRLSSRAQSPLFRGSCDELYVTAMYSRVRMITDFGFNLYNST